MKYRLPYFVRLVLSHIEGFRTYKWFDFNPKVKMSYIKNVEDKYIPNADIVISTWWATVLEVGKLSDSKGKKINLIQGFENWTGHEELLYSSYNMKNTVNVVVASYLKALVLEHTQNETILITNAIDQNQFFLSKEIESREPTSLCMLYSIQEIKGSKYGLEALKLVKEKHTDLNVELFGICPEPSDLPDWIVFHREPSGLCDLYNRNAIFISNSLTEGFGLVSVEAMACGCALICTDILGHREYAVDNQTALLVEPKAPQAMADKICYLIENNEERINIAKKGLDCVKHFSWEASTKKMDALIKRRLSE